MTLERKVGKWWLVIGWHKRSFAIGFSISKYQFSLDLGIIYFGLEF